MMTLRITSHDPLAIITEESYQICYPSFSILILSSVSSFLASSAKFRVNSDTVSCTFRIQTWPHFREGLTEPPSDFIGQKLSHVRTFTHL